MKLILALTTVFLTGCASQEIAQRHWNYLTNNQGITPGYSTGVSITNYTVNGQSYQVIAPVR